MAAETGGHQSKQSYFGYDAAEWHTLSDNDKLQIRMEAVRANQHGIKAPVTDTSQLDLKQLDKPLSSSIKLNKNKNKNTNKNTKSQANITTRHNNPISIQPIMIH